MTMTDLPPFC